MTRGADPFVHRIGRWIFYGWPMVLAGAIILFASGPGQSHTFGVFLTYIADDLELSHTEVSFAYGVATLAAAFGLPFAGRHVDRRGARQVLAAVAILLGGAAIAFGFVNGIVLLALGFAAVRYLGQGCLFLCASNIVAQWFERRRGFALSLVWLGFSASVALHPPFAQWLIDTVGWREAWFWLGISTWVLLVPILWFVRNRPEDFGLRPDGAPAPEPDADAQPERTAARARFDSGAPDTGRAAGSAGEDGPALDTSSPPRPPNPPQLTGLTLRAAVRTPAFWIVALGLALLSLLVTGLFFHQVAIFQHRGLDPHVATRVFAITATVAVISTPALGRLMDWAPSRLVFAGAQLVVGAALVALHFANDVGGAVAYAVVFGLATASVHVNVGYLWADYFGRRHLGSIQGAGQTVLIVGASLGPLPFSLSLDFIGDYSTALLGSAVIAALVGFTGALFLRYPRPPETPPAVQGGSE